MSELLAAYGGAFVVIIAGLLIVAVMQQYGTLALRHTHRIEVEWPPLEIQYALCESCTQVVRVRSAQAGSGEATKATDAGAGALVPEGELQRLAEEPAETRR